MDQPSPQRWQEICRATPDGLSITIEPLTTPKPEIADLADLVYVRIFGYDCVPVEGNGAGTVLISLCSDKPCPFYLTGKQITRSEFEDGLRSDKRSIVRSMGPGMAWVRTNPGIICAIPHSFEILHPVAA